MEALEVLRPAADIPAWQRTITSGITRKFVKED